MVSGFALSEFVTEDVIQGKIVLRPIASKSLGHRQLVVQDSYKPRSRLWKMDRSSRPTTVMEDYLSYCRFDRFLQL